MSTKQVTYQAVRKTALAWPRVEEGKSYGTSALKVKGKLCVRLREELMAADPDALHELLQIAYRVAQKTKNRQVREPLQ